MKTMLVSSPLCYVSAFRFTYAIMPVPSTKLVVRFDQSKLKRWGEYSILKVYRHTISVSFIGTVNFIISFELSGLH